MKIQNVIFASYGNDSIALIMWAYKQRLPGVVVAYSDTGWASFEWEQRVSLYEEWVKTLRMKPIRIPSEGMVSLVMRKKGWPLPRKYQFCTEHLKILPAQRWLDTVDPGRRVVCMVGVRRQESRERAEWPEYLMESAKHGGRELWSPLVHHSEQDRDELLLEAGVIPLPHRSEECFPCINANRLDMRRLTEDRICLIESIEDRMGLSKKGAPKTMFRPYRHMGATGIREVHRWAMSQRGRFEKEPMKCDSGMCGG